ncbi:OmpA family protein [Microvirga sp. STR05]|uniref:OmpA family protein n=1 Tax=Hymenobacter duratus TaxID=2771356 RepID=A0ABR8JDZ9_9BACT|nr:OmpA family protein [Hymenobacter duratus]MBD2715072.1 OmpA family protein [Hymenobacter duratus]MBR7949978.1 OmpA family protein [Microvirga sp. STR05]
MKHFITSVLLFCCSLLYAVAGQVQTTTGIVGVVRSADNQLLARASVTVVHIPSGVKRSATTDAAGSFVVEELAVGGPYTVQVSQPSYQTETVNDIFLLTGKTANGNFVLHPEEKKVAGKKGKSRGAADSKEQKLPAATGNAAVSAPVLARNHLTYIQQCQIIPSTSAPAARTTSSSVPRTMPVTASAGSAASVAPASGSGPNPKLAPPVAVPATAAIAATRPPATTGVPATGPATPSAGRTGTYAATRRPATRIAPPAVSGHYDAKSGNYIYDTGALTTLQLPNGHKLAGVGTNSTESFLYKFVADPKAQVDTVNLSAGWMSFDRVYFEVGKATLTKGSMPQLQNIAALMKAYPNIRLKIGGYTDSTGTYKMNRQLSEARARTAWTALVEMGVSPARLDARGYGSNYPVASNQTEVGRAMNRRLSVKVLQK